MAKRTSRKRNAPARLREEIWYLVHYEDDENMRVLSGDEIRDLFPAEEDVEEEEIQIGDIVSAIWLPNGQYYDAKILQKGADRNELMKERMKLEKAQKNRGKTTETIQDPKVQQKRKSPKDSEDGQKKKKKTENKAKSNIENEQKAKEKEEKKNKKDEEQTRQKFLLEARKAQAAQRWASTDSDTDSDVTIVTKPNAGFRPEPIHRTNEHSSTLETPPSQTHLPSSTLAQTVHQRNQPPIVTPPNSVFRPEPLHRTNKPSLTHLTPPSQMTLPSPSAQPQTDHQRHQPSTTLQPAITTPARQIDETPRTSQARHTGTPVNQVDETPAAKVNKPSRTSEPRRGLHFQSAVGDSSGDEDDESEECDVSSDVSSGSYKEQQLEIEALRKRLEKTHKRLNIALKAKTVEEVIKNRPGAGILDTALAAEYKMVELMEGSGVYWYSHQRAYCSAFRSWAGYINAAIDIFFKKETLAASCAMGNVKKSKNKSSHQPLNPVIIQALVGKVCSKFSKDTCPTPSQMVQKINMKCVEARRPPRNRQNDLS